MFLKISPVKGQIFKHEMYWNSKLLQVKVNFKKCPGQMVMLKMAQVNRSNLPPRGPFKSTAKYMIQMHG